MILIGVFEVNTPVHFLVLNTFLAYIPIELSFLLINPNVKKHNLLFWPIWVIWLLFYPNTPYILTDLFHLAQLQPYNAEGLIKLSTPMWISYTFLFVSAVGFALIGFDGLIKISRIIANKIKTNPSLGLTISIITILTFLSSVGVFIGRFLRIHTIYLFISPRLFITPLIKMWQPRMMAFVLLFTFIQLFIYWIISLIVSDYHKN
ncbi:DUF1361 domain-containing protein [uncultured bacterium]|uniref:DUF1361 domain-containing protein n=2 Tax=Acetilactobacillus jinshanensis TaxID=1720083 RepID=A0A4P6ZME4_9LACO|nr:DUF1361 domain-containing protein [Acetilactobacillus jinshanensis]URL61946.1 DUF1361 domain-containing protein [uncultured bacterium]